MEQVVVGGSDWLSPFVDYSLQGWQPDGREAFVFVRVGRSVCSAPVSLLSLSASVLSV